MGYTLEDIYKGSAEVTGKSTYGTHYKVRLENGDQVSLNRLREIPTKTQREIEAELNLVGKIRHPNLLAMRAYHLNQEEILVIYDYMPKGSIAAFFFGIRSVFPHYGGPKTHVDWPTRKRILKGVARGLLSLHTHHNMIHGSLTSHNIWLDENFNPKISDFGLSLSNMIATPDYKAPELMSDDQVNSKSDVYSLGIIMLELLTGKSAKAGVNGLDLLQWVALTEKEERSNEVFDHKFMKDSSQVDVDELFYSLQLALDCLRQSPQNRPDVQVVLQRLEAATSSRDDGGSGPSLR